MASLEAGDLGVPEPSSSAASKEPSFSRFEHAMHASMIRTVRITLYQQFFQMIGDSFKRFFLQQTWNKSFRGVSLQNTKEKKKTALKLQENTISPLKNDKAHRNAHEPNTIGAIYQS